MSTILFKLSSDCNLRCSYCYWFAEPGIELKGSMSRDVIRAAVSRLEEFTRDASFGGRLHISLHGGEPLLLGKADFSFLCALLRELEQSTGLSISISCQTNGVLLDDEWVSIFRVFRVSANLSIDGPKQIHDIARIRKSGRGSFDEAVRGLRLLQDAYLDPGVLAVWTPKASADQLTTFFIDELKLSWFDVLLPDATHESGTLDFSAFYIDLFDIWLWNVDTKQITIRICEALSRSTLGLSSGMESIGISAISTMAVGSNGEYELLDVLNVAGAGLASTPMDIWHTSIGDFLRSEPFVSQKTASLQLSRQCRECYHQRACGGGYLPTRWSKSNGFDNPSVHCESLYKIFSHVEGRLKGELDKLVSLSIN